ncbi:MAG: histidine kinase, partial [Acidobacteriota bacterium]|nr:histidine kinase [Acidobacteriota bacterium]
VRLLDTVEGVWALGKNSITLVRPKGILTYAAGRTLPGSQIETIFEDRRGSVWIGTNGGIARWRNGGMESIPVGGAPTAAVLSIFEDRDGDVWIGTEISGVMELRDSTFEIIGTAQGLAEEATTSVVQNAKGDLWVGTNGGGLSRIGGIGVHTYTSKSGLASDTVLALANGRGDRADLWVGTPDGLNLLRNGRLTVYTSAHGLADDLIRSILVTRDSTVWVGTRHGITRWKDGHATTLTTADGMGSDLVGAMFEDAAGDLWVGTLGGLSRVHADTIRNYTVADGLPSNIITALDGGADGRLWIGTNGQGLALFDGSHIVSFAAAPALPREIYAILEDGLDSLWISSSQGIYRIAIAELSAFRAGRKGEVAVVHYGTGDGLGPLEGADAGHPSAWKMLDGRLCFATRRGIVVVNPGRLPRSDHAPPVVLEEITVDDQSVTAEQLSSIAPGPSHFSFSFAGISLSAPQRVQYRYELEGFDRDWVDAGTRRIAFYTNIPYGRYRFRVNARDLGGAWSESGAEVLLVLRPHFYQRAWFSALLGILLAAAFFGLYRLRMLTLENQFNAVGAERSRIAREIHDTLAQGFVAVSTRLEIMSQMLREGGLEDCREQLDHARGLVRESLAEARRSIWNLRSDGVESRTLPARLARFIEQIASGGSNAKLVTTGVYRPLEQSTEDELCRIGEEAVTNAVRHASASRIRLCLVYAEDGMLLEVVDDGCGFDIRSAPSGEDGHFGLAGMRERARLIGTDVMLVSKPGQGTAVRVEVPMSQGRKNQKKRK